MAGHFGLILMRRARLFPRVTRSHQETRGGAPARASGSSFASTAASVAAASGAMDQVSRRAMDWMQG